MIQPRTLKGFRDYLPEVMLPREAIVQTARQVYRSFGFAPIDTPALEYLEVLTGKGSEETDKQLFSFTDQGGRDVGLRFDLTVPLARFSAQYAQQLGTPLRLYHIANVWRGEKPQVGRYREFVQCDFDTIGTTSVAADIETLLTLRQLLASLDARLNIGKTTIRINHRGVLNGLLEKLGLADRSVSVLRVLDKLPKIGPEKVAEELKQTAQTTSEQNARLLELSSLEGDNRKVLTSLEQLVEGSETGAAGVQRLRQIVSAIDEVDGNSDSCRVCVDPSIARGLDYYTGLVLETFLDDLPSIGSIASGGRYDDLAGLYTKQQLPGIGASLGADRLIAALEELGRLPEVCTPAPVFVAYFDADRLQDYLQLAATVRAAGYGVEVYPEAKKLGKQLQYASKRGFRVALIAGPNELSAGECQVKDLATGDSQTVPMGEVANVITKRLTSETS